MPPKRKRSSVDSNDDGRWVVTDESRLTAKIIPAQSMESSMNLIPSNPYPVDWMETHGLPVTLLMINEGTPSPKARLIMIQFNDFPSFQ
jgi:hypothetical protein